MKIKKQPWYGILLAFTIVMTLSALVTLIPSDEASKICSLGYKAHCTFTPWSTLISLALAMISCKIRAKVFVEQKDK
ncbi:MAG: hypothetical protein WCK36_01415 [Candidatus Firestonebacteria bacterium]